MALLLFLSLAPVLIILFYIYYRDKYEKEPIGLLIKSLLLGAASVIPVIIIEILLDNYWQDKFSSNVHQLGNAAYSAFIVAALTEELFKFGVFFLYVWRKKDFNERFDGIVYAVFISLGFAMVENILYVFQHGLPVAILRAFTAVPGHALFGIAMGYYLGLAKFIPEKRTKYIWLGLGMPILLHGIYDFMLMSQNGWFLLLFIPFIIFMWILNFKFMKRHSLNSIFKNQLSTENPIQTETPSETNQY
jgi:protease PrsW